MAAILMCDRCGNIYKDNQVKTTVTFESESGFDDWFRDNYGQNTYDVCRTCYAELRGQFTGQRVLEAKVVL